jgi:putative transcriptional regulator
MGNKLTGKALAEFAAERDPWLDVLGRVREVKAGACKRAKVEAKSQVVRVRFKSGLSQAQFAAASGSWKRALEQWEQGRREVRQASSVTTRSGFECCGRVGYGRVHRGHGHCRVSAPPPERGRNELVGRYG